MSIARFKSKIIYSPSSVADYLIKIEYLTQMVEMPCFIAECQKKEKKEIIDDLQKTIHLHRKYIISWRIGI